MKRFLRSLQQVALSLATDTTELARLPTLSDVQIKRQSQSPQMPFKVHL
jgi:hypothetical protein